jgi:hypothetical protein
MRSNSVASKVISAYSRRVGKDFIKSTLEKPINEVLSLCDEPFFFDTSIKPKKKEDQKNQMKKFTQMCQIAFNAIISSGFYFLHFRISFSFPFSRSFFSLFCQPANSCPLSLRLICYHLRTEVLPRFPQNEFSILGGFLFLRFFCPQMTTPSQFGVTPKA